MSLKQTIYDDVKKAMRDKDEARLSTLRMLSSAITNKEIELRKKDVGLSDEEVVEVIRSEAKKRKDSIESFREGGREELAEKESKELNVLSSYLPPEMSDEELRSRIEEGMREANAKSMADFSNVMKAIMPVLKGKASGDRISQMVREHLMTQEKNGG
ncbi:MAG: glutamyl-tRNA amidotransferase [Candidatus Niyogibacteria bacterium CG10_big_fil_rev_8_21_14_0_10_46_36]|uniref:Glutamyl-tRNA amidotransferase n=1 Tax=Candidatus Niyogibacteria bacterium CG10_big_fil_rev_8_21_14_0_10_46_36 TaxID=1974726 RepID=A0A2H0TE19_9BACT|nr:MAG: glutamyl-tRNA amidotransferase [Candidatus Niyogibacteria bacterium CG10_big_fil_rev_8_21_14_0_10_46_36]